MAINYKLKERGTGVTLYPETSTEQVYTPDGDNLKNLLPRMQEQINAKQPSEPGKGLSANDYSDDDKAAVAGLAAWKSTQFTIMGHTVDLRGIIVVHPQYDCTDFIPINRNAPLAVHATAGGGVPQVAFFDANKKFISGIVVPGELESEITDFPTEAVYFVISRFRNGVNAWYSNASTLESVQGAAAQAIQASKVALFDDMFKAAAGDYGTVDHAHVEDGVKKPYYLNGLWLTYEEAVHIYAVGAIDTTECAGRYAWLDLRTNLPPQIHSVGVSMSNTEVTIRAERIINGNPSMEVLNLSVRQDGIMPISDMSNGSFYFIDSKSLKWVIGKIGINHVSSSKFIKAPNLENIHLVHLFHNCDLSLVPKINLESLRVLVDNKYPNHPSSPVVTVHPDVYAKLADPENEEWHKVLTDALEKNITFATV